MTKKCECGDEFVELYGKTWCSRTLARYRALYGEPNPPPVKPVDAGPGWTPCTQQQPEKP